MTTGISGIIEAYNRDAGAVLVTPPGVAEHRGRMSDMRTVRIPLHSRKYPDLFALVDEEDYELVSQYSWHLSDTGRRFYAAAYAGGGRSNRKTIRLHRLLLGFPAGVQIDHINGNGLDNRRCNLRLATNGQNQQNKRVRSDSVSGYKGVYQHKKNRNWIACIRVKGKQTHLGVFSDAESAARAYDDAARKHFGAFARLNFPEHDKDGP